METKATEILVNPFADTIDARAIADTAAIPAFGGFGSFDCFEPVAEEIIEEQIERSKLETLIGSIAVGVEVRANVRRRDHERFANGDITEGVWAMIESVDAWNLEH